MANGAGTRHEGFSSRKILNGCAVRDPEYNEIVEIPGCKKVPSCCWLPQASGSRMVGDLLQFVVGSRQPVGNLFHSSHSARRVCLLSKLGVPIAGLARNLGRSKVQR